MDTVDTELVLGKLAQLNLVPINKYRSRGAINKDYVFGTVDNNDGTHSIAIAQIRFLGIAGNEEEAFDIIQSKGR